MTENVPNEHEASSPSARDAKAQVKAAKAYAKAQRPFYKKKRFILPAALVALIVMVQATSGAGDEEPAVASSEESTSTGESTSDGGEETEKAESAEQEETKAPGLRTPVRDGKFEFTVKSFKCGVDKIGSSFMTEKAQGQFCIATVKVSNIGDESQMFDGTSQYLYDAEGREFTASTEAAIALPESQSFLEDINPGNTVSGKVVWDVPKSGFKAERLELHDSMLSGGVEVTLK